MSILDKNVVDIIGINAEEGIVDLIMTDHLEWNNEVNEHLYFLQEKINCYLMFIESGQLVENSPKAKGCKPVIVVKMMYEPSAAAIDFIAKAQEVVRRAGFDLRYEVTGMPSD